MGLIERVLLRWGYVRLGRYGLELGPDDRVVVLQPDLPVPVSPPPVALPPAVEEDEWEWEIAMARARATAAPAMVRPMVRPRPRLVGLPGMPPPRRFPRATEGEPMLELDPDLVEPIEDATVRTLAVPPAQDDDTSPGLLAAPPPPRRVASRSR
jgi:hypothetical protein